MRRTEILAARLGLLAAAYGLACSRPPTTEARAGLDHKEGVTNMAPTTAAPPRTNLPPVDSEVPARVETATFAMG
ncbi:MAG: hypothetical protein L0216_17690 [Planctomycetales bacterium]|nr:hypothetical protein [Planctomycetales bacterium]